MVGFKLGSIIGILDGLTVGHKLGSVVGLKAGTSDY